MKTALRKAKVPFGTAKYSAVKNVRYLSWEDAFEVEFEDGLCILEPHATIRRANKISPKAKFERLEIEDWTHSGFFVHYDTGEVAEVSWSFIRELPPTKQSLQVMESRERYGKKSSQYVKAYLEKRPPKWQK